MPPLQPHAFIAGATVLLGFGEATPVERGNFVDAILRESALPQHAQWDLAFIHHVGWWTQRSEDGTYSSWTLPRDATHRDLAVIARERKLVRVIPAPGDIVLYCSEAEGAYTRSAIIVSCARESLDETRPRRYVCRTIEGNLSERGEFGGMHVREMRRVLDPLAGDLFIRWAAADARRALSDPGMDLDVEAGRLVLVTAGPEVAP